jgi:predicted ATPase
MRLINARIINYRGFNDSGEIRFGTHATVIVGRNNVGKTGLLEAINLELGAPHRNPKLRLLDNGLPDLTPRVLLTVAVERDEMSQFLLMSRTNPFWLPVPDTAMAGRTDHTTMERETAIVLQRYNQAIADGAQVLLTSRPTGPGAYPYALFPEMDGVADGHACIAVELGPERLLVRAANRGITQNIEPEKQFAGVFGAWLKSRVYLFRASRATAPTSALRSNDDLAPDLSNLPSVLQRLNRTPNRFRRYRDLVTKVLPEIQDVTTRQMGDSGTFEVLTYAVDASQEDEYLAMSLAESGSGVSQVLGILYVAVTARTPRLIIIDEPQSFLHPGAIRNLFEILRTEARQHQYIIATHSSVALSAIDPERVLLLTRQNAETVVATLDVSQRDAMSAILADLGARLSDIFGADRILWVEGRTEEECFRVIVHDLIQKPLLGVVVLGLRSTGELEGRHAEAVIDIYNRLSRGPSLLPTLVGFVLDRETRSDAKLTDLRKHAGGQMWFLERRMFENYLLVPDAIAAVFNSCDSSRDQPLSTAAIRAWLESKDKLKLYGAVAVNCDDPGWSHDVNGAKLLVDLFDEQSDHRVSYDKVSHGKALTAWIVEHRPHELKDVRDLLWTLLFEPQEDRADLAAVLEKH